MKYLTAGAAALPALGLSLGLVLGLALSAGPAWAGQSGERDGGKADKHQSCRNCPKPRPHYDSTEVIKQTKDVDHSRVIETEKVIPSKRVIETNHLIIHENETRHVGTVQHNHTIIEKEIILTKRNVDHQYINRVVDLVQHKYHTERKHIVEEREIPGEVRHLRCDCGDRRRPLRRYGKAADPGSYGPSPKYVKSRY